MRRALKNLQVIALDCIEAYLGEFLSGSRSQRYLQEYRITIIVIIALVTYLKYGAPANWSVVTANAQLDNIPNVQRTTASGNLIIGCNSFRIIPRDALVVPLSTNMYA